MFSGFHYYSINNLKLSWGLSLYSLKIKICQIQMSGGGLFKVRMSKQQSTTCPNIFRIWGVEFPNQGGSYEATSDPPLWAVTPMATLSEWKSKRSQKLSKKMSKCANFTITAAKSSKKQHMPSAANIIFFQLHQKRHGIKKTQDWHFAPWAFSLLVEPAKVFLGPWRCPRRPFWRAFALEWLQLPGWPPTNLKFQRKMLQPIGNCSFAIFRWVFCEKFGC